MPIHPQPSQRLLNVSSFIAVACVMTFLHICASAQIPSSAQKELIDSLENKIKIEKNDTVKVRLHFQIANKLRTADTTGAWRHQREIVRLATEKENDYFRGESYLLAATLQLANHPVEGIANFENAIRIFVKYPGNRRANLALGIAYINLGLLHYQHNDYETAIENYLKAEDIYLKTDPHHSDLGVLYSNLSIAYGTINKYGEGLKFSKKGLDFARRGNDKSSRMGALYAYGGNLVTAKKGDEGLIFLDSAKMMATEMNNPNYLYGSDFMKAMYYYNTKQYDEAIKYYTACLNFAKKYNSSPDIGNNYLNISACEAELKKPRQAAAHLDSSAKYLDYSILSVSKQNYFENYAEVYKQLGNFTKAFAYKDSVGAIKDSLYKADNIKQLEFRQARYNYEKRQTEIEQLEIGRRLQEATIKQKNILNYLLIGGTGALLLILFLSYRTYSQKQKLQLQRISELEIEKKLAATEAVLKGEEQERTRLAKDLHDGLGGMLSGIKYGLNTMKGNLIMTPENAQAFERSVDMLDSSIREMRRVAHNMMPEALVKFGLDTALRDYCNDIHQSGALQINYQSLGLENAPIDQTTAITIYRVIQELVTNIVKHAGAQSAIVQVTRNDGALSVTVEDDGKGFDTTILRRSNGIGWTNIQNRVEFLKGKLDVNSQPGKGTSVLIELTV
ncbi:TPR repeat-containing protein [Chryseolinea serpens]|uniref:TPR repeat-containing protein n=1 Tax=Chryseolinea serpens TaxID=947013 RepID=A0A1M5TTC0_9BACT|nr:sensor histidine kinase [Chryseolinea serpens]SHH53931.1 TPR repeat-containing protein [Chryseolinea serpens]